MHNVSSCKIKFGVGFNSLFYYVDIHWWYLLPGLIIKSIFMKTSCDYNHHKTGKKFDNYWLHTRIKIHTFWFLKFYLLLIKALYGIKPISLFLLQPIGALLMLEGFFLAANNIWLLGWPLFFLFLWIPFNFTMTASSHRCNSLLE